MQTTITLDTGNAAFCSNIDHSSDIANAQANEYAHVSEVERIIKHVNWHRLLTNACKGDDLPLYDYNGNKVGRVEVSDV